MNTNFFHHPGRTRFAAGMGGMLLLATLAACGGGGGNFSVIDTELSAQTAVGNYSTGCAQRSNSGDFKLITATFSDAGQGKGKAIVHYKTYGADSTCAASSVTYDITGNFDVAPSAQRKVIAATAANSFAGTANVVEATLTDFKLSRGGFSFPSFGAVTKVGYSANGNVIRFVAGTKEADGLGIYFSDILLTKVSS